MRPYSSDDVIPPLGIDPSYRPWALILTVRFIAVSCNKTDLSCGARQTMKRTRIVTATTESRPKSVVFPRTLLCIVTVHVVLRVYCQEVVYDDPRFEDGQKKERARAKMQCLEDTRCCSGSARVSGLASCILDRNTPKHAMIACIRDAIPENVSARSSRSCGETKWFVPWFDDAVLRVFSAV